MSEHSVALADSVAAGFEEARGDRVIKCDLVLRDGTRLDGLVDGYRFDDGPLCVNFPKGGRYHTILIAADQPVAAYWHNPTE